MLYLHHHPVERPRATAVLVHGLNEHGGRYVHVARRLAEWGIDTLAYDQRGFGRSSGGRGDAPRFSDRLEDLEWVIARQRASHPGLPLVLFGHSMGGLVACRYLQQGYPPPDLFVLSGPAIDPRGVEAGRARVAAGRRLARLLPLLRVPYADIAGISTDPAVVAAARHDPLWVSGIGLRMATQIIDEIDRAWAELSRITLPALLLHGEADRIVPVSASREGSGRFGSGDVTLHTYPGMLHEVFNERQQEVVFRDLRRWLDQRLT